MFNEATAPFNWCNMNDKIIYYYLIHSFIYNNFSSFIHKKQTNKQKQT